MKRKPSLSSKSPATKSPATKSPSAKRPSAATGQRSRAPSAKPAAKKAKASPAQAPEAPSKQSQLITLLRNPAGASMEQMMALTGWQPHTVRGMLSGSLRKRLGLDVQCQRVEGVHRYRIVEAAAA